MLFFLFHHPTVFIIRPLIITARIIYMRILPLLRVGKPTAGEPDASGIRMARTARGNSPCRARWPTSSAVSPSRSGQTQRAGSGRSSPGPATESTAPARSRTGSHGGESQQAPRLTVLPIKDGALSDRPVSGLDHPPPGRHLLVVPV